MSWLFRNKRALCVNKGVKTLYYLECSIWSLSLGASVCRWQICYTVGVCCHKWPRIMLKSVELETSFMTGKDMKDVVSRSAEGWPRHRWKHFRHAKFEVSSAQKSDFSPVRCFVSFVLHCAWCAWFWPKTMLLVSAVQIESEESPANVSLKL